MRGVVRSQATALDLTNFPDPTLGPDEVGAEMKASGMCGSDLHQYRRPTSQDRHDRRARTVWRVVVAVGSGVAAAEATIGDRMMVHHYQGCTQCSHCRSGWQQLCRSAGEAMAATRTAGMPGT